MHEIHANDAIEELKNSQLRKLSGFADGEMQFRRDEMVMSKCVTI